jgi:hypothetical protein
MLVADEALAARVLAAVLRIPKQRFDSSEQLEFAKVLSYNAASTPGLPSRHGKRSARFGRAV